jgi:hypothetical protein
MFEQLLAGWKAQGYAIVSLALLRRSLDTARIACHEVIYGQVPGRSGTLALQGPSTISRS